MLRNLKLLHISDIHIGVESYGKVATEEDLFSFPVYFAPGEDRSQFIGMNTRLLDFLSAMDEAVAYAIENRIDLVLFAGDAYKSRDPSQTHQREFAKRINRLSDADIPVFLTVGNHDLPHIANRATSLEIFPTLNVKNITVSQTLETHIIGTPSGDIQVVGLPWIRIGQFMAKEETRNMNMEEIKQALENRLTSLLETEVASLDKTLPSVLCAHVNISGSKTASERSMMLGNDHLLSLGSVAIKEFDYVALGNIHKYQILTHNPPVVYAGSIERVDFSEEKEDKGFVSVQLDPTMPNGERLLSHDFIPVHARSMITINVSPKLGEDPTEASLNEIEKNSEKLANAIVRFKINLTSEQEPHFNESEIRQKLNVCFYFAGIEKNISREHRTRIAVSDAEKITPSNAIRKYFETKSLPKSREEELMKYVQVLLQEEFEDSH